MKVLVVEDDKALCGNIASILQTEGYKVVCCHNGDEGLYYIQNQACDMVILDRMLPGVDGIEILNTIRKKAVYTPILMLSAMNTANDRINGLDAGADDYMNKPFEFGELLARVRALIRRPAAIEQSDSIHLGDLTLDSLSRELQGPQGRVSLTKREAAVLELFMRNQGGTLSRATIFNRVWGPGADVDESNVTTYIHFLRRRLAAVGSGMQLVTKHGSGFSLTGLALPSGQEV